MGEDCDLDVLCKKTCISETSKRYLYVYFNEDPNFNNIIRQTINIIENQNEILIRSRRNKPSMGFLDSDKSKYNCGEGRLCIPRCQTGKLWESDQSKNMYADASRS